jgi:predicted small secreted protein
MKKQIVTIMILGITLLSLNACATIAGAGKDIQRAGQVVEDKARGY